MEKIELFVIISMIGTCESDNGESNSNLRRRFEPFIVGGSFAKIEEAPHSVFLLMDCKGEQSICGSSVLTQNLLLTAAHCVNHCCRKKFTVTAHAGHADLLKCKMKRSVTKILVHENYCHRSMLHDVAVIYLERDILLGRNVKRVDLPSHYIWAAPYIGITTGWGITDHSSPIGGYSKHMKLIKMKVQPDYICSQYLMGKKKPGVMCAGNPSISTQAPSGGDSGSALIIGTCTQVGLVSFTSVEAFGLLYYTNVTYFYDWIRRSAKKLICNADFITPCIDNYC